ncbi:PREDICTED: uncharacterized protein LOC104818651 [Tarenaya hassleriana]|uniref:uncharacterized protein LOC104818651 n=1 Tax=Tarenaya hassleriana TaxID=28532 RepID=UPI00053C38E3|nr:PREDICTED: uncharacterized protein LOC104818651 [Tarenaya hassleriana]
MEKNLSLRPFELGDVKELLKWAGDERVTRYLQWPRLTTEEEAFAFVRDVCLPHPWRRSICLRDRSIGFVSVFPESAENNFKAYFGYGLSYEHWGKGIATRAVEMAVSEVLKDLPHLLRLQAFVQVENKASQRILEKTGFQREGLLRKYISLKGQIHDVFVYSLLPSDLPLVYSSNVSTIN